MANADAYGQGAGLADGARPTSNRPDVKPAVGYLLTIAMTAAATLVAIGLDSGVTIPNVSLVFVIPVIAAGVNFGLGQSALAAVLGAMSYNFFLTEPRYSLMVDDPANIWAIVLLLVVGAIVSTVAFTARRRTRDIAQRRQQVAALGRYSRDLSTESDVRSLAAATSGTLVAMFGVPAVVVLFEGETVLHTSANGGLQVKPADIAAARSALDMTSVVRADTYPAPESQFDFWPVNTTEGVSAVIGVAFDPEDRPSQQDELVDIVRAELGLALGVRYSRQN